MAKSRFVIRNNDTEMSLGNSPATLAGDALGNKETERRCGIDNNRTPPDA